MILINSSTKEALKIFQPFLPIYVPVGVGFLLAITEREGIKTRFIDEQVEENIFEKISGYVKEMGKPYIFGFSTMTAAYNRALFVSKRLKELYPGSIVCFGGIHPSAIPDEVLSNEHIDIVVRGEGELVLPGLYRCIKEGRSFADIENISYRQNGKIVHNNITSFINDLDSLPPFPYHRFTSKKYDLGFVVSSRGCPYGCIFCSNRVTTGMKYRYRPSKSIVDDLEVLYHKYGKTFINFLDDNFLVSKKRTYALIDEIRQRRLDKKMTFSFQARGDNADYKLFKDLYSSGFRSVFFGMETVSNKIMKLIKKGETVEQCVDAVRMAKELGFHVSAAFIYGLPTETHSDRISCAKLSKELEIDMVRFNNATPYPGTELYQIAKREGALNIQNNYENFITVSTFIENPFRKIPFSYVPVGSTENEIRSDILFSYFICYMDIKKIKRILTTSGEGAGWFSAGEKILETVKKIPALVLLGILLSVKFGSLLINMLLKRNTSISFGKLFRGL